jgi:hypothetical protein
MTTLTRCMPLNLTLGMAAGALALGYLTAGPAPRPAQAAASVPTPSAAEAPPTIVDHMHLLGDFLRTAGAITAYDVNVELFDDSIYEVTIGSLLPGDARLTAEQICSTLRQAAPGHEPWRLEVYLAVGNRPAASCRF